MSKQHIVEKTAGISFLPWRVLSNKIWLDFVCYTELVQFLFLHFSEQVAIWNNKQMKIEQLEKETEGENILFWFSYLFVFTVKIFKCEKPIRYFQVQLWFISPLCERVWPLVQKVKFSLWVWWSLELAAFLPMCYSMKMWPCPKICYQAINTMAPPPILRNIHSGISHCNTEIKI